MNANEFTKDGYVFDVWNTKADGSGTAYEDRQWNTNCFITADSQTCNDPTNFAHIGETVTLYAQWTEAYTIHFNGNESKKYIAILHFITLLNKKCKTGV